MKKFTILSLFAAFLFVGVTANAQEQGGMMIHGGLGIATGPFGGDESVTGFGGGFEYVFADAMSGTVEYYSYSKDSFTTSVIGVDYKYYFLTEEFKAYGKAGLTSLGGDTDSTVGVNLGIGGLYGISDSFGIGAGLDYNLAKPDGAEDPFGVIIKFGASYMF